MSDDNHSHAALGKLFHYFQNFADHLRIERAEVGSSKSMTLRFHRQCSGDSHALFLPAGQFVRIGILLIRQSDFFQELYRFFRSCFRIFLFTLTGANVIFSSTLL